MHRFRRTPPREQAGSGPPARPAAPAEVVVAGGGIAGVAAALVLAERGARVTLLEPAAQLGGRVGAWRGHPRRRHLLRHGARLPRLLPPVLQPARPAAPHRPRARPPDPVEDYPLLGPDGLRRVLRRPPEDPDLNLISPRPPLVDDDPARRPARRQHPRPGDDGLRPRRHLRQARPLERARVPRPPRLPAARPPDALRCLRPLLLQPGGRVLGRRADDDVPLLLHREPRGHRLRRPRRPVLDPPVAPMQHHLELRGVHHPPRRRARARRPRPRRPLHPHLFRDSRERSRRRRRPRPAHPRPPTDRRRLARPRRPPVARPHRRPDRHQPVRRVAPVARPPERPRPRPVRRHHRPRPARQHLALPPVRGREPPVGRAHRRQRRRAPRLRPPAEHQRADHQAGPPRHPPPPLPRDPPRERSSTSATSCAPTAPPSAPAPPPSAPASPPRPPASSSPATTSTPPSRPP
jgi:hypothetical protein